jgi:hypothetical protein
MEYLQEAWEFCVHHWPDFVMAIVFAVIADLLRVGSLIRNGWRHLENKLAEGSTSRLRQRISELECLKATYVSYSSSDKALYLGTLHQMFGILICICGALACMVFDRLSMGSAPIANTFPIFSLVFVGLGIAIGVQSTTLDRGAKVVPHMITKLEGEILALKGKLDARTRVS